MAVSRQPSWLKRCTFSLSMDEWFVWYKWQCWCVVSRMFHYEILQNILSSNPNRSKFPDDKKVMELKKPKIEHILIESG